MRYKWNCFSLILIFSFVACMKKESEQFPEQSAQVRLKSPSVQMPTKKSLDLQSKDIVPSVGDGVVEQVAAMPTVETQANPDITGTTVVSPNLTVQPSKPVASVVPVVSFSDPQTETRSDSSTTTTTTTNISTPSPSAITKTVTFRQLYDVCATEPCLNGGTCYNAYEESQSATSSTVTVFTGRIGFYCKCPAEYSGIFCDMDSSNCSGSGAGCLNHGFCRANAARGECVCPDGVDGAKCDHFSDPSNCTISCLHGGFCNDSSNVCQCPDGFTGTHCEVVLTDQTTTSCSSVTCKNGGFCFLNVDGALGCACTNTYYGATCEYKKTQ